MKKPASVLDFINPDYELATWSAVHDGDKVCLKVVPSINFRYGKAIGILVLALPVWGTCVYAQSGIGGVLATMAENREYAVWTTFALLWIIIISALICAISLHIERNLIEHGPLLECDLDTITIHPWRGEKCVVPRGGKIVVKRVTRPKAEFTEWWLYVYQTTISEAKIAEIEGGKCKLFTALERFCDLASISMEVSDNRDE